MGTKYSIYEKPGSLNYYKLTQQEYLLIKDIWSDIELNPSFHGAACFGRYDCE